MEKHKFTIVLIFSIISNITFAQEYLLKNEEIIFSFETRSKKKIMLAKDKDENYIICRYGTLDKIEIEFPEKTQESWGKFSYSYSEINGNIENALIFRNKDFEYAIYDCFYIEKRNKFSIGMRIINKNKEVVYLRGKIKSQKGKLVINDLTKIWSSVKKRIKDK
ncbi:MAG TPA: hypothetical protein DCM02_04115 [Flavobacterium sp.]|nr:hypothetical protein [Flavobacterium sp.]HAT75521.1 hypothetical protein [Flavobacterium sp.]HAT81217.1 hypothetical protein [Flavobacterium sp.]